MPAKSKAQAVAARIAEHHPEKLYERNKGLARMSKEELHKFAATKDKGLPAKKESRVKKAFRRGMRRK